MFWSDLPLREGLKAKKRVTGLVLAVILSFVGELVQLAMWACVLSNMIAMRMTMLTATMSMTVLRILRLRKDEPPTRWALEETETKWYPYPSEGNVKNNRANKEMPSLLGSDTNGASSQGGVPRLHMGLPSSVDCLSGTSSSSSSSSSPSSSFHHSDHYLRSDYGARSCVHQLLSEPTALCKDVKQLPTWVFPGEQCLLFMWFIHSRSWPFINVRRRR